MNWLRDMITREDDYVSLVRVMALILFVIYCVIFIAAFFLNKTIPHFTEFSSVLCFIVTCTLVSKYEDIQKAIRIGGKP